MKNTMLLLLLMLALHGEEPKALRIIEQDGAFELTDAECIAAIVQMTKTKEAYKDPGLPPIGEGGDTKIAVGKRVVCEVNLGLEYFAVGKKKFTIPAKLLPQIKLAIEGPEDPWQLKWVEWNGDKTKQRDIETRDMAVQKRIAAMLKPYLGGKAKRVDDYPMAKGVRYSFNTSNVESIEYDVAGGFIYNNVRLIKLSEQDNLAFVAFLKTLDAQFAGEAKK